MAAVILLLSETVQKIKAYSGTKPQKAVELSAPRN